MVDTGDLGNMIIHIFVHSHLVQNAGGANLNAVAQTDHFDSGMALQIAGEHCHRIGVIQKPRVGADFFHICGKIPEDRNGSKGAEDTADS